MCYREKCWAHTAPWCRRRTRGRQGEKSPGPRHNSPEASLPQKRWHSQKGTLPSLRTYFALLKENNTAYIVAEIAVSELVGCCLLPLGHTVIYSAHNCEYFFS